MKRRNFPVRQRLTRERATGVERGTSSLGSRPGKKRREATYQRFRNALRHLAAHTISTMFDGERWKSTPNRHQYRHQTGCPFISLGAGVVGRFQVAE